MQDSYQSFSLVWLYIHHRLTVGCFLLRDGKVWRCLGKAFFSFNNKHMILL